MAPNNCIYCGNPIAEQTAYCPRCGRPQVPSNQQPPQQQTQYTQQQQQQYQQPAQQPQQHYQQPAQAPQPQGQYTQQPTAQYPNQYQPQGQPAAQYPPQGQYTMQGQPQQPAGPYPPQGQYPQQSQPTNDPGKSGNKLWIIALLAGLLIAAAAVGGWMYWKNTHQEEAVAETDSITDMVDTTAIAIDSTAIEPNMAAPEISIGRNGVYSVDDCPTSYDGLDVQLKKSEGTVKAANIYRDGELIQTLNLSSGDGINYYDGASLVHFLDANFDGNVDMIIGMGEARNYSGLFLWNPETKQFDRATDNDNKSINADLFFAPKEKAVYASYSEGGGMSQMAKMEWDGKNMKVIEWFLQMESWRYSDFGELNISHHYNVVNRNKNRIIFSTDDPNAVPAQWKKWVYEEYANAGGIDDDGLGPDEEY